MSQAILFAIDALHDHLQELTANIDKNHFADRRVQLRNLSRKEGAIRACIAILESIAPATDTLSSDDGEGLHSRPQQEACG